MSPDRRPDTSPPAVASLDVIDAAVRFVAAQADGPARLLATHFRLTGGSCAGCMTTMARWPCSVARIAHVATAARNDKPPAPPHIPRDATASAPEPPLRRRGRRSAG